MHYVMENHFVAKYNHSKDLVLKNSLAELPTVTKNSYLLRKSEGNTKIRKGVQKVRIHGKIIIIKKTKKGIV